MRALFVPSFPGDPQVGDLPKPAPGPGELLVRVAAGSINGVDVFIGSGAGQGMVEHRFPLVLGKDFAGVVEAVGDDVTGYAVGDAVYGTVTKPYYGAGSLGEYVTVPAEVGVTHRPDALAVHDAGALGLAGTTALLATDALALTKGETVLVSGATGGVGAIAVQYAAAAGARVIATARDERQREFLASLAPVEFADYSAPLGGQVPGVDAALHFAGDLAEIAALVKDGGRIATTLFAADDSGRDLTLHVIDAAAPQRALLDRLATDVVDGVLRVPVSTTYELARAHEAYRDFAGGALGKIAVSM
ncbi:NADP-dependent oxidoreductase [Actinoplanes sp. TBRC 11911]|uniref:NADP-dependent oxidoreductase n=1 Tax=Actinoplanes sp. TBRC 11911 TaxID=2729386 RepID=UPI00145DE111|nr:NADP-dependent oxidoreductase [Actinoplanes sp. TBRC 11911]NMO51008.1 NADP-dependent oxidoreductase [Actinoplanes sp. TBRC 11911]